MKVNIKPIEKAILINKLVHIYAKINCYDLPPTTNVFKSQNYRVVRWRQMAEESINAIKGDNQ
jgi:hypothetical protein